MNYKGHVPEFGPYSVTTNSHKRFGGKSNKIKFKNQENSVAEEWRMSGKERKEGSGSWVQGAGSLWLCGI